MTGGQYTHNMHLGRVGGVLLRIRVDKVSKGRFWFSGQ